MTGREYRGMTAEQRLADRRERLLSAGFTLFADTGFPTTTIERLCAAARISNRSFYECFPSGRDELMRAVYDRCVAETITVVTKAVQEQPVGLESRVEVGIGAYIDFVTRDRRRARIMHLEVRRAGDALTESRQRAVQAFTRIIEESLLPLRAPVRQDLHLLVLGVIGAIQELLIEWVLAPKPPPIDRLTDTAVHIFRRSILN